MTDEKIQKGNIQENILRIQPVYEEIGYGDTHAVAINIHLLNADCYLRSRLLM